MTENWQKCEGMNHVGPEEDDTVEWHDIGLRCDTCAACLVDVREVVQFLRANGWVSADAVEARFAPGTTEEES